MASKPVSTNNMKTNNTLIVQHVQITRTVYWLSPLTCFLSLFVYSLLSGPWTRCGSVRTCSGASSKSCLTSTSCQRCVETHSHTKLTISSTSFHAKHIYDIFLSLSPGSPRPITQPCLGSWWVLPVSWKPRVKYTFNPHALKNGEGPFHLTWPTS